MKYKSPKGPRRRHTPLSTVGRVLTRLQPYFVQTVSQSSVYSPDQRKKLVDRYRQIVEDTVDGVSRQNGVVTVKEEVSPDFPTFRDDDVSIQAKFEGLEDQVQYFVSLGLNIIEKLYLTNRIPEDRYVKYKRLLRFIPKFHVDLLGLWDESRKQ